jgi:hypothetical protein
MPYSSSANDVFSKVSTSQQDGSNGSICEKYLYGEHPSKTLFVKKKTLTTMLKIASRCQV